MLTRAADDGPHRARVGAGLDVGRASIERGSCGRRRQWRRRRRRRWRRRRRRRARASALDLDAARLPAGAVIVLPRVALVLGAGRVGVARALQPGPRRRVVGSHAPVTVVGPEVEVLGSERVRVGIHASPALRRTHLRVLPSTARLGAVSSTSEGDADGVARARRRRRRGRGRWRRRGRGRLRRRRRGRGRRRRRRRGRGRRGGARWKRAAALVAAIILLKQEPVSVVPVIGPCRAVERYPCRVVAPVASACNRWCAGPRQARVATPCGAVIMWNIR